MSIPIADQTPPGDAMKAMEDARRQLSSLTNRELDGIKSIFGSDASLRTSNTNSNLQENGARGTTAFVSVSNTYAVRKPPR